MSYTVIKTIRGRRYRYLQTSWREGRRVRTRSVYLGPVDGSRGGSGDGGSQRGVAGFLNAQRLSKRDRALASAEREAARIEKYQRETFGETAAERGERVRHEELNKLHDRYGLKIGSSAPAPVENPSASDSGATDASPSDVESGKR